MANLEPTTIDDVAESFKVARARVVCPERGEDLVAKFYAHLDRWARARGRGGQQLPARACCSSSGSTLRSTGATGCPSRSRPPGASRRGTPPVVGRRGCPGMRWRQRTRMWYWSRAAALTFVAMSQTPSRTPRRSRSCERLEKAGSSPLTATVTSRGRRSRWRPARPSWRGARTGPWAPARRGRSARRGRGLVSRRRRRCGWRGSLRGVRRCGGGRGR